MLCITIVLLVLSSYVLAQPNQPGWGYTLAEDCKCWAARYAYWQTYPDVLGNNLDPVYHFMNSGYGDGHQWPDCAVCAPETNPMVYNDERCSCDSAKDFYANTFGWLHQTSSTAWEFWVANIGIPPSNSSGTGGGLLWHCDYCNASSTSAPTNPPSYILAHNVTCIAAREQYLTDNKDVDGAYLDPVFHYQSSGGKEGRHWSPQLCDTDPIYPDTDDIVNCPAAQQAFLGKYGESNANLTADNSYAFWVDNYLEQGYRWMYELCFSTQAPATPSPTPSASPSTKAPTATPSPSPIVSSSDTGTGSGTGTVVDNGSDASSILAPVSSLFVVVIVCLL